MDYFYKILLFITVFAAQNTLKTHAFYKAMWLFKCYSSVSTESKRSKAVIKTFLKNPELFNACLPAVT